MRCPTGINSLRPMRRWGISPRRTASYAAERPSPRTVAASSTVMVSRAPRSGRVGLHVGVVMDMTVTLAIRS